MNRVELVGKMVRPPERSWTKNGYPMLSFTVVVDGEARYDPESKQSIASSNFISCILWGPQALRDDLLDPEKGEKVYVLGELDQSSYEKQDGTKESKTRVRVHKFDPLERSVENVEHEEPATF